MRKGAYHHLSEEEWLDVPRGAQLHLACCDCSLVHVVEIRKRGTTTQLRFARHERATAALRKKGGKK